MFLEFFNTDQWQNFFFIDMHIVGNGQNVFIISLTNFLTLYNTDRLMQSTGLWQPTQGELRKKIMHYSYFLGDRIGDGFSSTVYIGTDDNTNEKVAIKVIELKFITDDNKKKLMLNELECIRKIGHTHLLKYIDTYETANNIYIITEYCEGGDMEKQLKQKGRLTEAEFGQFFAQFYSGYVNLLDAGFIHRDIKPANILLKNGKIRVADFGIVKKTSENPRDTFNVGTLVYMAPQSILECIYNQKSDVWSMGVMFYQLTHGRLPWKLNSASDKKATINQILNRIITYDNNWLSAECINFIEKCLKRNSVARFEVKQMMEHQWAKKAIKNFILNEKKFKQSSLNEQNISRIDNQKSLRKIISSQENTIFGLKGLQLQKYHSMNSRNSRYPRENSASKMPYRNVNFMFTRGNENMNTLNEYESVPRDIREDRSPFQKMRQKLTGNMSRPNDKKIENDNDEVEYVNPYAREYTASQIHNYLLSVVNYLRYLHQVIGLISSLQHSLILNFKNQLLFLLISQMMNVSSVILKIVNTRENTFYLLGWEQYVISNFWETDADFIRSYEHKYKLKYNSMLVNLQSQQRDTLHPKFNIGLKEFLMQISRSLSKVMQQVRNTDINIFELIKAVDVLFILLQLNQGILLTQDQAYFRSKFDASEIVDNWSTVNLINHVSVWQTVEVKLETLLQP